MTPSPNPESIGDDVLTQAHEIIMQLVRATEWGPSEVCDNEDKRRFYAARDRAREWLVGEADAALANTGISNGGPLPLFKQAYAALLGMINADVVDATSEVLDQTTAAIKAIEAYAGVDALTKP